MKLTKDQAEYLIDSIKSSCKLEWVNAEGCDDTGHWEIKMHKLREIINKCTEKEFPEFDMETKGDCGNVVGTLHVYHDGGSVWIEEDVQGQLSLLPDEFECFTEACNKIVEWFKEQK